MSISKYLSIIIISLLILPTSSFSQVEFPFDYFYGRWVDGHSFNYSLSLQDFDLSKSTYSDRYLFTNNSLQIDVRNLGDHILWDEYKSKWDGAIKKYSPIIGVRYRIGDRWQIGIENVRMTNSTNEKLPSTTAPLSRYLSNNTFDFSLNSIFSNKKSLEISEQHAPFAYLDTKIFTRGNFVVKNNFYFNRSTSYYNKLRHGVYDSSLLIQDVNISEYLVNKSYSLNNQITYGISDDINIIADINFSLFKSNEQTNSSELSSDDYFYLINENIAKSDFRPSYTFSIISGLISPVYMKLLYGQTFEDTKIDKKGYFSRSDMEVVDISKNIESDIKEISSRFSFNMTYISKGKFDQNVILADYNNYYRKMLFQNQYLLSIKLNNYVLGFSDNDNRYFDMKVKSAYGLTSQMNIEGRINYSNYFGHTIFTYFDSYNRPQFYEEKIFSSENLSFDFKLSYLSNSYGTTPTDKWSSDSKYDILFGNILKAKEYYMQVSFSPPSHEVREDRKLDILGFNSLKSDGWYSVELLTNVGVGKFTEFLVQFGYSSLNNQYNDIDQYHLKMGVDKRMYDKLDFLFSLNKSFGDNYIFNPYWVNGAIKLLL